MHHTPENKMYPVRTAAGLRHPPQMLVYPRYYPPNKNNQSETFTLRLKSRPRRFLRYAYELHLQERGQRSSRRQSCRC